MKFNTLIDLETLAQRRDDPNWKIVDCRFALANAGTGRDDYARGHIPNAVYADLDEDLSGLIVRGQTGRHPMPDSAKLAEKLSAWGIADDIQVVAYDAQGGALAAARFWWLLRWLGHRDVAVLDGGWPAWQKAGLPITMETPVSVRRAFRPQIQPELTVSLVEMQQIHHNPAYTIIDVRTAERYRGEVEPIDPVAGHIPGAINIPFAGNLTAEATFQPLEALQQIYRAVQKVDAAKVVCYCGSGVTAAQTVLAMTHAGLDQPRLYAGSWSEWITDPANPIGLGAHP